MKKCLVLGGGFAGLTSAVYLSKAGFKVEVLEASPKLGGRAYSFKDPESGTEIDNGQHILMGCYSYTLGFLREIHSIEKLKQQKSLAINFLAEEGKSFGLVAAGLPYPLSLLSALINYGALTFGDKLTLMKFFLKLPFITPKDVKDISVLEWLESEGQGENLRKAFWDFLSVSALNIGPSKASAELFLNVLKQVFLHGNMAAAVILPGGGLSELYCVNAKKYIEDRGGVIRLSEKAEELIVENNVLTGVRTGNGVTGDYDFVISALPLHALEKILPGGDYFKKPPLKYSAILSVHLWTAKNDIPASFFGLIGSPVHWLFNNGTHLTTVISDADKYMDLTGEEIFELICEELERYTVMKKDEIKSYKVIKEKRATYVPSPDLEGKRPGARTGIKNLFLAGDWVETGLPSTIESAVKSGVLAAEKILNV